MYPVTYQVSKRMRRHTETWVQAGFRQSASSPIWEKWLWRSVPWLKIRSHGAVKWL